VTDASSLSIGSNGSGYLNLGYEGSLTTAGAQLGANASGEGEIQIDPESSWTSTAATVLGGTGHARLKIKAGMETVNQFGTTFYFPARGAANTTSTVLGRDPFGGGVATVSGFWQTGDLVVGNQGSGDITCKATSLFSKFTNVSSVGALSSGEVLLAAQPGSTGTVTIAESTITSSGMQACSWAVAGSLALGGTTSAAGGVGKLVLGGFNTVSVGGNWTMWPGGDLDLTAGGTVSITGSAALAGTLDFKTGKTPHVNDVFQVLTAGSVSGTFSTTNLPALPAGDIWKVQYNSTNVKLIILASADFDENGVVNGADLVNWKSGFGTATGAEHMDGDADGDFDADGADFLIWQRQLGSSAAFVSANAPVPEPATAALMIVAAAGLRARQSRAAEKFSKPILA
jgi:hypothetical protein